MEIYGSALYKPKKHRKEGIDVKSCRGCLLNTDINNSSSSICTTEIYKNSLTCPIYLNKKKEIGDNRSRHIPFDLAILEKEPRETLLSMRPNMDLSNNETFIAIEIKDPEIKYIEEYISSEDYREDIIKAYKNNKKGLREKESHSTIEFYTDGSLRGRGTQETTMGAAVIQTKGPCPGSSLLAGVNNWPSACRAEATAIMLAILTTPRNCKVTVCTDSQGSIDMFNRLEKENPQRIYKKWLKEKNWSIWSIIVDTVRRKKLTINFVKIKAHSGNTNNDKVDLLAKQASQESIIEWSKTGALKIATLPVWNDIIIDMGTRDFVKVLNKNKITMK